MQMGIIGLGKMGRSLAKQALEKEIDVVGLTIGEVPHDLTDFGLQVAKDLNHFVTLLSPPRKIFLYVPAGKTIDDYLTKFRNILEKGDIVIDSGNSYWGDSIRRHKFLGEQGIKFLDVGTSGGVKGALEGACFMVGGDKDAYEEISPILEKLSAPNGQAHIGPSGSGHLVKLIHNGIEFGMLQAIGEGVSLLERYREHLPLDMEAVFQTYKHGSVIRSWLIDIMSEQYFQNGGVKNISSYIEDTGEVNWLVQDSLRLEVPIPVIAQSLNELFRSRDSEQNDHRSVALMRHGFGGHPLGPSDYIREERLESRIRPDFPEELYGH